MPDIEPASVSTGQVASASLDTGVRTETRRESFDPLPPRLRAGMRLDRWYVADEISTGATASVFAATEPGESTPLAIKVLSPHLGLVPRAVVRFHAEVDLLGRIDHPGVVKLCGSGKDRGHDFFVMRRETSRTAHDLRFDPGLSVDTVFFRSTARLFAWVARALEAVHEAGVVHRDVKPDNLLLSPSGKLVLCDFGSALDFSRRDSVLEQCLWGTVRYMSPDQFRADADPFDRRIDIYGLGLTLQELVTGECAVPRGTEEEIVRWKLSRRLPAPRRQNPRVSLRLDRIIRRATAPEPEDRYPTMARFAEDLERFAGRR